MDYILLGIGLVLLIMGADSLVKGAVRLATSMGIPSLVVGLTIVAFGTSAPELAVSIRSASAGQSEMAIANVVGSNIFNVLFILGVAALITPLAISKQLIRQDVPIMVMLSLLVFYMSRDGSISRLDASLLVVLLIGYTTFLFVQGKRTESLETTEQQSASLSHEEIVQPQQAYPVWQSILWAIAGLVLLVFGAKFLVDSAVNIARTFAVSEAVIGLTIIAIGTSLPEVVTSIVASLKGQRDIAVGNVVGSNTFNLLAVLGISGLISNEGLVANAQLVNQDFLVMLAAALLCLPLFFTGSMLSRTEGALFFCLYVAYSAFLIASAIGASWLNELTFIIGYVCVPLTVLIILGSLINDRFMQG